MKLSTKQFGEIEFDENLCIQFTEGILGFEELKRYVLISEENGLFFWLTSVDEPEIVFPLFPINTLQENYPQSDNFEAFGIVKLSKDPSEITINLKAPIYLDRDQFSGFQKILDTDKYPVDYKLFVEK